MFAIILRTIKDRKISLLAYCLASALFVWMFVAMYPSLLEEAEQFQELFKSYPPEFFQAFGMSADDVGFDTIEKFLSLENFSILWPLMAIFMVISIAAGAISMEIERGTIENFLAKPVSRLRFYFGRYLAGVLALLIFTVCSTFSIIPFAELHNIDYALESYFYMAVVAFLFGWAVFSLALMFSAIFSERSRTYMAIGIALLLMYVANIVSGIIEQLESLKYLSFFYYYDYTAAIQQQEIAAASIAAFASVAVVSTIVGAWWYNKRDIAT